VSEALRVAELAGARLAACQQPNGLVTYEVNAVTGKERNAKYNMVRMAGVTYSLCWLNSHLGAADPAISKASRLALQFLTSACELQTEQGYYVCDFTLEAGPSHQGKLGSTALFALALTFRDDSRDILKKLIATINAAQLPSGGFRGSLHEPYLGSQRYYSGEALLALVRYSQVCCEGKLVPEIGRAFEFYERYFTFDPHPGFLLWHIDAWTRAAVMEEDLNLASRYVSFAEMLGREILARQIVDTSSPWVGGITFSSPPGVSTSLYSESLARVAGMLRRTGSTTEAHHYFRAARMAFDFVKRLQVSSTDALDPRSIIGGFRSNLGSDVIRMDNDQHVITNCLALLEEDTD
jgi:hypothetical protein